MSDEPRIPHEVLAEVLAKVEPAPGWTMRDLVASALISYNHISPSKAAAMADEMINRSVKIAWTRAFGAETPIRDDQRLSHE